MDKHKLFIIFKLLELQISLVVIGNVRFGAMGNGSLRGDGECDGLGAMSNGRLRGDGDYEGGGQRAIRMLRGDGDYEGGGQLVIGN